MSSPLDLFLNDSTTRSSHQPAKKAAADSTSLDWLFSSTALDVLAPHPDAFDSELDSIALGSLDSADLAALPAIAIDPFFHSDINFYQYRGQTNQAPSQYSGYGGAPSTITSSESLSAYGSVYDSQYEPTPSVVSNNTTHSLSSLFPDLDFTSFELSPSSPSIEDMMLNAIDARTSNTAGSRSSTSPSFDATSPSSGSVSPTFYPITSSAAKAIAPSYLGTAAAAGGIKTGPSLPQLVSPSMGSVKNVPVNANSALVTGKLGRDGPAHETDPRKKYTCPNCPRAFARAFNLKTHMATHDPQRVKNFHCRHSGCGRSFSRKHDLGRHMVSIHQDTTPPVASGGDSPGSSAIGVGSAQRIWCDNCGRGWLAGSRDACECDESEHRVH